MADPAVSRFQNEDIRGQALDDLVTEIHKHFPSTVEWATLFESLEYLAGEVLGEESLEEAVWRLAANQARLKLRIPAGPWVRQEVDEVVPVQVLDVHFGYTTRKKFGGNFELQVLAGTMAPMVLNKFWTAGYCRVIKTMLGFSKPWGKYPFEDIRQFVGLRFSVRISAELSGVSPNFEKIWQEKDQIKPPTLFQWNRLVMRRRNREVFQCPRGFALEDVKCHFCVAGREECRAATHLATYEKKHCRACDKESWFDPEGEQEELCVQCYQQSLRRAD